MNGHFARVYLALFLLRAYAIYLVVKKRPDHVCSKHDKGRYQCG